jgi:hypothetical protein
MFISYLVAALLTPYQTAHSPLIISKLYYRRRHVGQSLLVSGIHLGPAKKFSFFFLIIFRSLRVCWCGGILLDERADLYFTILAGPRQRSLSRLSQVRLKQPGGVGSSIHSPPGRGSPSYTPRQWVTSNEVKVILRPTVSRPLYIGIRPQSVTHSQFFFFPWKLSRDVCGSVTMGRPLGRENGSIMYICCWAEPAQSLLGQCPTEFIIILQCLNFETPPTLKASFLYLFPPRTG